MKKISEQEMLHKMAAWCSTAERCCSDVEQKIKAAGFDIAMQKRIVTYLQKEKYIDEARYCRFFVNDKLRFNKWGKIRIIYELQRKGIPGDLRYEAINAIDDSEYQSILCDLLTSKKRITTAKNECDLYFKLMRFASGRGFEPENIRKCLKEICKSSGDDEGF